MENCQPDVDMNLVKKYDHNAFMYVEYPHKSFWSEQFNDGDFKTALQTLLSQDKDAPLMLYIHIPFCPKQCFYCTCRTIITSDYERSKDYLKHLYREIDLYREVFEENSVVPNFQEIHIGGGSPTLLREKEFDSLIEKLQSLVDVKNLSEFSIEIDPREVDEERMRYYHSKGINRISFGVQDFDPDVQKSINRIQPPELIENLLTPQIRQLFSNGVNFDIICGLPLQSPATMKMTFERIVKISPDRVCLNHLHYSPKFAKHQQIMTDGRNGRPTKLPDSYEKKVLFNEALKILVNNGYLRTGYDHFAKPTDEVAKAMQKKNMHWNSLGVTAGRYLNVIGLGVHSYSTIGNYYSQNVYELSDYQQALSNGKLPIYRGYELNNDDLIRRDIIQSLRNYFALDYRGIEEKYNIDFSQYFSEEIAALDEFAKDRLVKLTDNSIVITELGRQFANLVCGNFDAYAPKAQPAGI